MKRSSERPKTEIDLRNVNVENEERKIIGKRKRVKYEEFSF